MAEEEDRISLIEVQRVHRVTNQVEATLQLFFADLDCEICGKHMLCVLPDNSHQEKMSVPLCRQCLNGLFSELAKARSTEGYVPRIRNRSNSPTVLNS